MKAANEIAKSLAAYRAELTAENFDSLSPVKLAQGTEVRCNGFAGVIVRHYHATIHEIRLPGGVVATGDFELVLA